MQNFKYILIALAEEDKSFCLRLVLSDCKKNLAEFKTIHSAGIKQPFCELNTVLEPWCPWHHASIKKILNLTSPVFDLFSIENVCYQFL